MKNKLLKFQMIYTSIIFIIFQIQDDISLLDSVCYTMFILVFTVAFNIILMSFGGVETVYKMKVKVRDKIRVMKVCFFLIKLFTLLFIFNVIFILFSFLDILLLQGKLSNLYVSLISAPMWLTIQFYLRNYCDEIKNELGT